MTTYEVRWYGVLVYRGTTPPPKLTDRGRYALCALAILGVFLFEWGASALGSWVLGV